MSLSIKQTAGILKKAGFKDAEIPIMVAIGIGESGLDPKAHNPTYPDDSFGVWQINMLDDPRNDYFLGAERRARYGLKSNEQLKDPLTNAKAALDIRNTQGLNAWSVYKHGIYKDHLPQVQKELAGGIPDAPSSTEFAQDYAKKVQGKDPVNVLALKDGVQGVLDKTSGKFTARDFTDAEALRYERYGGKIPEDNKNVLEKTQDFVKSYFLR